MLKNLNKTAIKSSHANKSAASPVMNRMALFQATLAAVREAMRVSGGDPQHVCSIGVSGQQHGMIVLDGDGQVSDDRAHYGVRDS